MKTVTFCVRDFRDYLTYRDASDRATQVTAPVRALLDSDYVQNFLYRKLHFYAARDEALNAPIAGETGIDGLRLDFNFGLRLEVPAGNFRV